MILQILELRIFSFSLAVRSGHRAFSYKKNLVKFNPLLLVHHILSVNNSEYKRYLFHIEILLDFNAVKILASST